MAEGGVNITVGLAVSPGQKTRARSHGPSVPLKSGSDYTDQNVGSVLTSPFSVIATESGVRWAGPAPKGCPMTVMKSPVAADKVIAKQYVPL